jgi:uncharacterized protein (TIGR03083 family)
MSGYLAYLKSDGEGLAVAASLNLRRDVPSCPGWTVAELVRHTGRHYRRVAGRIRAGDAMVKEPEIGEPPEAEDLTLIAWHRAGLEELLDVLSTYPSDAPCWTFHSDKTVSFWHRRCAMEIAVHRWDAENAQGRARPIAASLAPDGIDEFIDVFLDPARFDDEPVYDGPPGVVALRAGDAGRHWKLESTPGEPVRRAGGDAEPDLTVRGTASKLMLLVWGRYGLGDVEAEGDEALWEGYRDYAARRS